MIRLINLLHSSCPSTFFKIFHLHRVLLTSATVLVDRAWTGATCSRQAPVRTPRYCLPSPPSLHPLHPQTHFQRHHQPCQHQIHFWPSHCPLFCYFASFCYSSSCSSCIASVAKAFSLPVITKLALHRRQQPKLPLHRATTTPDLIVARRYPNAIFSNDSVSSFQSTVDCKSLHIPSKSFA